MSLIGLFTLDGEAESVQPASFLSKGEGESLLGPQFLNELVALLAGNDDQGSQQAEEAAGHDSGALLSSEESLTMPDGNPKAVAPQIQSPPFFTGLGLQAGTTGEPSGADAADKASGQPSISNPAPSTSNSGSVTAQASTAAQAALQAATSPSTAFEASIKGALPEALGEGEIVPNQASSSKMAPVGNGAEGATSLKSPERVAIGAKAAQSPNGRQFEGIISRPHAEGLNGREALARPFDRQGNVPHELQRLMQTVQRQSVQAHATLGASAIPALDFRSAQLAAWQPAAQTRSVPAPESQPASVDLRPTADNVPRASKAETESGSQEGGEFDSSRQGNTALRSGAAAHSAAHSQAASSGARFADLLQAQTIPLQPGLTASEAQAAKAAPSAAGEGILAEAATVRGQDADQVFSQVVQNARLLSSQGETRFEIRLKPEFLGKIQIQTLISADQKMTTRFLVEDPEVRALLESRLPMLAERLGESGLRIATLEVQPMNSQGGGDSSRSAGETGGQNRQQQESSGRAGSDSPPSESDQEVSHSPNQAGRRPGGIHLVA